MGKLTGWGWGNSAIPEFVWWAERSWCRETAVAHSPVSPSPFCWVVMWHLCSESQNTEFPGAQDSEPRLGISLCWWCPKYVCVAIIYFILGLWVVHVSKVVHTWLYWGNDSSCHEHNICYWWTLTHVSTMCTEKENPLTVSLRVKRGIETITASSALHGAKWLKFM